MPQNKRPPPTPAELEVLAKHTLKQSAEILGLSYDRVRRICVDNDVPYIRLRSVSSSEWGKSAKRARRMWMDGDTIYKISNQTRLPMGKCCQAVGVPTLPKSMWHINRDVVDWIMLQMPNEGMGFDEFVGILLTEMYESET
jgi:hypothetical protein